MLYCYCKKKIPLSNIRTKHYELVGTKFKKNVREAIEYLKNINNITNYEIK
jgi:hypothetical protein